MPPPPSPPSPPSRWVADLVAARAGSADALGRLLNEFRTFLGAIAAEQLDTDLQAKADASDLVQESLHEAQRAFAGFRDDQPEQFRAWLRVILLNNVANFRRHWRDAEKRDVAREVRLQVPESGAVQGEFLVADDSSPSSHAARREGDERICRVIDRLPEDYRNVVVWRLHERLSFEVIGRRLDRPAEGARQLWWRALKRLRDELGDVA